MSITNNQNEGMTGEDNEEQVVEYLLDPENQTDSGYVNADQVFSDTDMPPSSVISALEQADQKDEYDVSKAISETEDGWEVLYKLEQ